MFLSIPGHILALVNSGELQVIAARGDRYEKVTSWRVAGNSTWAPPVLLQDRILIKDRETLTLWSLKDLTFK